MPKHIYQETIGGEIMPVYVDSNRGSKVLSVSEISFTFGENAVGNNDFLIPSANATDNDSCYICLRDSIIVGATYNCEDAFNINKDLQLFINNSQDINLFTTNNNRIYQQGIRTDLDIDLIAGDRLRVRGGGGGTIRDTVVTLYIKWRKK